jgi:hypothetical protein
MVLVPVEWVLVADALAVTTQVPTARARTSPLRSEQEPAGFPATDKVITLPAAWPGEETVKDASVPTSTAAIDEGEKIGSLGEREFPTTETDALSTDLTEIPAAFTATTWIV